MQMTLDEALRLGVEAHRLGKVEEADRYYTAILGVHSGHPDANHNMGVLAVGLGKLSDSIPYFERAVEGNSGVEQYWLSYISALLDLGRLDVAVGAFDRARGIGICSRWRCPPAHSLRATACIY